MKNVILCKENFEDFAIGEFPYDRDHSAMGEYQYVTEEGYHGRWLDQVCNYTYNGTGPTWIITEQDGIHAMECMRIEKNRPHRMFPTLETGEKYWRDLRISVTLRRLSQKGMAGIVFCLNHSIDTLVFYLEGHGKAAAAYRHKEEVQILSEAEYPHNCDDNYRLTVDCNGSEAVCFVNGTEVLRLNHALVVRGGKVGITADCPSRFTNFEVLVTEETETEIERLKKADEKVALEEQSRHPKMRLWKKIDLKNFGTSRQIRFGHLTGDAKWFVVLAQMQKRVSRDAYGFISCLTAVDLDGTILWQLGEPSDQAICLSRCMTLMGMERTKSSWDGILRSVFWTGLPVR